MDMPSSNSSSDGPMEVMMTPWLHFAGGDNLFFKSWHPKSGGAIAGACIALVAIAILERWVSGMRGNLEKHWRQKTLAVIASRARIDAPEATSLAQKDKDSDDVAEVDVSSLSRKSSTQDFVVRSARVLPPFIASHDLPRGAAYALQAFLAYVLMLAVMTFQAAYFISIVAGLGVGEMLFGRMGSAHLH